MNTLKSLVLTILIAMVASVNAQDSKPGEVDELQYRSLEVPQAKIRQSSDGSGIIQGVTCDECDFKIVKITPKTKVILNGNSVDLLTAREYAGQLIYVVFDQDTAEVIKIYL